jgi:3'-5' exoribonuclease
MAQSVMKGGVAVQPVNLLRRAKGDVVEGIVLIKTAEVRTSSTGSRFLDATLMDATGEMNGKGWDWGDNPAPATGRPIKLKGMVLEYMGKLQMRIDRMRDAAEHEVDWDALVPCAPEPAEEMYDEAIAIARGMQDRDLGMLTEWMYENVRDRLLIWPAAVSFHHAERSGLLYHTLTIARAAKALLTVYPFLDADLLLCGALLHDLNKIEELAASDVGIASTYTREGLLLGHIARGVERLGEAGRQLGIPQEKLLLVQHMLLSHHSEPEYGSPRRPMFPEAELLHHLDNIDARMYEMKTALAGLAPGEFTGFIRSLDNRRLYRRGDVPADEQAQSENDAE